MCRPSSGQMIASQAANEPQTNGVPKGMSAMSTVWKPMKGLNTVCGSM